MDLVLKVENTHYLFQPTFYHNRLFITIPSDPQKDF